MGGFGAVYTGRSCHPSAEPLLSSRPYDDFWQIADSKQTYSTLRTRSRNSPQPCVVRSTRSNISMTKIIASKVSRASRTSFPISVRSPCPRKSNALGGNRAPSVRNGQCSPSTGARSSGLIAASSRLMRSLMPVSSNGTDNRVYAFHHHGHAHMAIVTVTSACTTMRRYTIHAALLTQP
jgi:hypothetical protein